MKQIGKLALRVEGDYWNAYYAFDEEPVLLGSIHMNAIIHNEDRKTQFMDMMWDIIAELIEETTGLKPEKGIVTDPPSEDPI